MSERDCGKWYCQNAAGFRRLEHGVDILVWPGTPADADDRAGLLRERREVTGNETTNARPLNVKLGGWMGAQRDAGFTGWLAAYSHGNGAARYYWVWDPDSRGKYLEAKYFDAGFTDPDFGRLHRGRGWQLPLVAVYSEEPTQSDLDALREARVPYTVLGEEPVEDPPDDDDDDELGDDGGDVFVEPRPIQVARKALESALAGNWPQAVRRMKRAARLAGPRP